MPLNKLFYFACVRSYCIFASKVVPFRVDITFCVSCNILLHNKVIVMLQRIQKGLDKQKFPLNVLTHGSWISGNCSVWRLVIAGREVKLEPSSFNLLDFFKLLVGSDFLRA